MQDALGVIHSLHGQDDLLALERRAKLLLAFGVGRVVERFVELAGVDADGVHPERGAVTVGALQAGDPRVHAEQALGAAAEVPHVAERVKAEQVRPEHSFDQFAPARVAAEHLERRERRVQEKTDPQGRQGRLEQGRQQEELVIVDPDDVALFGVCQHLVRKPLVDLAVSFPPRNFVAQVVGHVVEQRPYARIGEALVK